MSLINIGLVLISALFHSFWNILTQTSQNSQFFSGLKGLWIIVLALIFYLLFSHRFVLPHEIYFWGALSGLIHGLYILCLSKAYSTQDISYVYPIARSAPVFVPAFAYFFLGESLSPLNLLGIATILLAIYILHFEGHLIQGFKKLYDAILHQHLRWSFFTLGMVVSYSLVDKRAMSVFIELAPQQAFANGIIFFFLEAVIGFILYLGYLILTFPRREILSVWKNEWKPALLAGMATLGSYGLICVVLQFEWVSAVVSLRQTSVLMVVYWGCWKLGEPFGRQRILAAALIVSGIVLISINNG